VVFIFNFFFLFSFLSLTSQEMFIGSLDFYEFFGDHLHTGVQVTRLGEKLWNLSNPKYIHPEIRKKEKRLACTNRINKKSGSQEKEERRWGGGGVACVRVASRAAALDQLVEFVRCAGGAGRRSRRVVVVVVVVVVGGEI
jgi:hypothetical protein